MKRVFTLALGLSAAAALMSPSASTAQMSVGVGGGIVAATFSGSDAEDFGGTGVSKGSRVGMNAGAWLNIPVASSFAIVPGGFFAQKGVKYTESGSSITLKANYIEIPLFASVTLTGEGSSVGFNIFAGPTFAFESGCNIEGEESGVSASVSCDDAGADERQKFDIGLAGGAGASFPISERLSILVSGGYDLGLRKLDTSDPPDDIKNSAFFATVGVGIPLG